MDYRRLNPGQVRPEATRAMAALGRISSQGGLDKLLLELVKLRASQINGCGFCIGMHAADARKEGEDQLRLDLLGAWHEAPCYSARERAALAWTEGLTRIADATIDDAAYAAVREYFSEEELVELTMAIVTINGWNRIAIAFGAIPGSH